jgi:hypothetical protein
MPVVKVEPPRRRLEITDETTGEKIGKRGVRPPAPARGKAGFRGDAGIPAALGSSFRRRLRELSVSADIGAH